MLPAWSRFIIGRPERIDPLADLAARFAPTFRALGNKSWPEEHLTRLLRAAARRSGVAFPRRGPWLNSFVRLGQARQNRDKYRRGFLREPGLDAIIGRR